MKKILTSFCLLILSQYSFSQSDISNLIKDKNWTINIYAHEDSGNWDTLFTALNCQEHKMVFKSDGSFETTRTEKAMSWTLSNDSTLSIFKGKNKTFKKGRITSISSNHFTFLYFDKKYNSYIKETYALCNSDEKEGKDSRPLITFTQGSNIYIGAQQGSFTVGEIGYVKSFSNSMNPKKNNFVSLGSELNFFQNTYGAMLSAYSHHSFILYGMGIGGHVAEKKHQYSARLKFGVNGSTLNDSGKNFMLYYSLNLPLSEATIPTMNSHSITLRYHLPISQKSKEERRNNKFIEEHQ